MMVMMLSIVPAMVHCASYLSSTCRMVVIASVVHPSQRSLELLLLVRL